MPRAVAQHRVAQGIDFGEFFFWDSEHPDEDEGVLEAIDQAYAEGRSVGIVGGVGVVIAPIQYGTTTVTVEVWDGEPPVDLDDEADDLVDLDWTVTGDLMLEEPTADPNRVAIEPGRYRLRIAGFGLPAAFEQDREADGDADPERTPATWTFRLWPRTGEGDLRYRRAWAAPVEP